jgi:hypothetical protein
MQRKNLLYKSAYQIWKDSEYYTNILINTCNILLLSQYNRLKIWSDIKLSDLSYDDDTNERNLMQRYLLEPPEKLMFPDDINEFTEDSDKIINTYRHPLLIKIFRQHVLHYQYLCNKSNEERISIYMDEINDLYNKIKFIQTLIYFGVKKVIYRFKETKYNYLSDDPEIKCINQEPNLFQDISYKEALYKFYIYCMSREKINSIILDKLYFLGDVVTHFQDICHIIINCIIPLSSCIRQDKLKQVCGQVILSYLKPNCVSDQYIMQKLVFRNDIL